MDTDAPRIPDSFRFLARAGTRQPADPALSSLARQNANDFSVPGDLDGALGTHEHGVADRVGALRRHHVRDHVPPVVVAQLVDLRGDQLALAVPAALAGVDPGDHDFAVNSTGSEVRLPLEDMGRWVTSPASSQVSIRRASTPSTSAISIRASCA